MLETLLRTKLFVPSLPPNLISRSRLYDRLNEGSNRKLTLVSAPAGFGKSTLIAGWLAERGVQAAWFSLDQGDSDPVRFWTYLIAGIQSIHQEVGVEARQIIGASQLRSTEPVVISLINDISQLTSDMIVVLDDYHLIEAQPVHDSLSFLLEHQPPNLHLVLLTRADPSISLARLRAHGRLVEIRATDLQFSTGEAALLFNDVARLDLKSDQIEALNQRAEGWIVGLNLAALSLKGQPTSQTFIERLTGSHKFILDYLTEEVVDTLPEELRQFLLRTSILARFNAALCEAVASNPGSQQVLDELHSGSLFLIPLDANGTWFRYHHLFAEVLYALLKRDHPDEIDALHLQAAEWFESQGYASEAVDHALCSADIAWARELVLKHGTPFVQRGEVATVLSWLDALPESKDGSDPSVPLARCWALFLSGQNSAIEPHLERANIAYEQLVAENSLSRMELDQIAAQLAMMRSVLASGRGEHAKSVAYAEEAVGLVPSEMVETIGTQWNMLAAARGGAGDYDGAIEAFGRATVLAHAKGNLVAAYGATYGQAMYLLVQGRLNEAQELCLSAIDSAKREGHGEFPAAGSLYVAMARIELERYHVDESGAYLDTGLRVARPGGFSEVVRTGRHLRAHLAAARGDLEAASDIFRKTERIVNAIDNPYLTGELNWEWARLCLRAGDLAATREKLHILERVCAATQHANLLLWRRWLYPRLLCAEQRFEEAVAELNESIPSARVVHSNGELIRLLALQAVVLEELGERTAARATLREALELGAPGGYIWRWLEAGPRIVLLLRDLRDSGDSPVALSPYLDSLLVACREAWREVGQNVEGETAPTESAELLDPLTAREKDVLRLIGKGYSNPEIANELVVSVNTVKKHTSNIYGKLGVSSRTQAVARAHELDLI